MVANLTLGFQRHVKMKLHLKVGVSGNHGKLDLFLQVRHERMAQDLTQEIRQETQPSNHVQ